LQQLFEPSRPVNRRVNNLLFVFIHQTGSNTNDDNNNRTLNFFIFGAKGNIFLLAYLLTYLPAYSPFLKSTVDSIKV